jgi:hypothetical protein
MACERCNSHSVGIKTLTSRKLICQQCEFRKNESCSLDGESIRKKAFSGACKVNKFPKIQKRKAPPLLKQFGTFVGSMKKWAKSGFSKVNNKEFKKRLDLCKSCEWWDSEGFAKTGRCMKCGCSTQAKLRLKTEKCPVGKW